MKDGSKLNITGRDKGREGSKGLGNNVRFQYLNSAGREYQQREQLTVNLGYVCVYV